MDLAIMIPMDNYGAAEHVASFLAPEGWRNAERVLWPELEINRGKVVPCFPSKTADETQAIVDDWIARGVARGVIVTRSEMVTLRVQRMLAEGATFTAAVYLVTSAGEERHEIGSDGEVKSWPRGLFSEDFEEVKAIRRAQEKRGIGGRGDAPKEKTK